MTDVFLVGVGPVYNELETGHLPRFLKNVVKVVDGLVFLDDASTDGSYEAMLQITPHVLRNRKNMFMREQFNQHRLIEKALEVYPQLTHIINLNADSTYSPACFKDGDALIHKACERYSKDFEMFMMREVNLWRSTYWWRMDGAWRWKEAERVYVRRHGFNINKWFVGLHVSKDTSSDPEKWLHLTNIPEFQKALTIHWGWSTRDHIVRKVHNYLSLEKWRKPPCPEAFKSHSVFSLMDEWDLKVSPIYPEWYDEDLKDEILSVQEKPTPISYYQELIRYDQAKAECYKKYFEQKLGYYKE